LGNVETVIIAKSSECRAGLLRLVLVLHLWVEQSAGTSLRDVVSIRSNGGRRVSHIHAGARSDLVEVVQARMIVARLPEGTVSTTGHHGQMKSRSLVGVALCS
jgi:hypothetical protein